MMEEKRGANLEIKLTFAYSEHFLKDHLSKCISVYWQRRGYLFLFIIFFPTSLVLMLPLSLTKNDAPSSSEIEWVNVFESKRYYIAKVPASTGICS